MEPRTIFIIASLVILLALVMSFVCWLLVWQRTKASARFAALFFVICFGLYIVGQALALLQGLGIVEGLWSLPSLLYALAALLFAGGSWQQWKSLRR